jgi:histidinol-phosphate/aromatic aminotransferase/cobyric acid decarboxylase-like protein
MPAKPIVEELRRVGILVRDWRDREFLNQVRITVGRPEDTDAIVHSLGEILRKQEKPNQTKS